MEQPKRRYVLTLTIGADTMEDVKRSLDEVQYTLNGVDERNWSSILGGPSAGFILDIAFNPDVTHESYFEQLEAYKQSRKESSVDG